jgi:hypothetical protein
MFRSDFIVRPSPLPQTTLRRSYSMSTIARARFRVAGNL